MPATAAVTLDLKTNTASASRGLDALEKRLQALQKQGGIFMSGFQAQTAMRAVNAAVGQADSLLSAFAPETAGSPLAKAVRGAAASGSQLAAAFAPFAPPFGAVVGASVGAVAGAMKSVMESSREAAKALEAEAAAGKKRVLSHRDRLLDDDCEWENADDAKRGKMQAEARERIRKARFKLEAGASVGAADVYGVANWDRAAQGVSLYMFQHTRPHWARPSPSSPAAAPTSFNTCARTGRDEICNCDQGCIAVSIYAPALGRDFRVFRVFRAIAGFNSRARTGARRSEV